MAKKKSMFWRDFGIGVASSVTASIVVAVYLGAQIQSLRIELRAKAQE